MIKYLKRTLIFFGLLLLAVVIVGAIFINTSPQFGAKASEEKKLIYEQSPNNKDGRFVNKETINMEMSASDFGKTLVGYFRPNSKTRPDKDLAVLKIDSLEIVEYQESTRLVWSLYISFADE